MLNGRLVLLMKMCTIGFLFLLLGTMPVAAEADAFGEAPELAELAAEGEIHPVDERLPEEPHVVEPIEQVGQYGGTMRVFKRRGDPPAYTRTIGYEPLVRFPPHADFVTVKPNLAKDWEVSEDATEFTFHLREGLRWSDGEPMDAEDIMFWWEDVVNNEEITPAMPATWVHAGEPMEVEMLDQHTVKFTFAETHGTFLSEMGMVQGADIYLPRHYLKQYHADYVDEDELEKIVDEEGYDSWVDLIDDYRDWRYNPERPTMNAWQVTTWYGVGTTRTAERNPYYWKVDTEGNQLPYVDSVRYAVLEDVEPAVMQTMTGEYDFVFRDITSLDNYPVFQDAKEEGNYRFKRLPLTGTNTNVIQFNLTHEDPETREVFQDRDFRVGVSHALDREKLIELAFLGMVDARQPAPHEESPFYHEGYANAYLDYDPEKAEQLLDAAGLDQKDGDGWRLLPSGERLDILMLGTPGDSDITELIAEELKAVGLNVEARIELWGGIAELAGANEHDAVVWWGAGGMDVLTEPRHFVTQDGNAYWGAAWGTWYATGGEAGEEPPEDIKKINEWYEQAVQTLDLEEQQRYMEKVFDMHEENLYVIGVSDNVEDYTLVSNDLRNVPEWWWGAWAVPHASSAKLFQFYFTD